MKAKPRHLKKTKINKIKAVKSKTIQTTKKMVDQILVKMPPGIQSKIDQISKTLEGVPAGGDLKQIALKVLARAKDISKSIKTEAAKAQKGAAKIMKTRKEAASSKSRTAKKIQVGKK